MGLTYKYRLKQWVDNNAFQIYECVSLNESGIKLNRELKYHIQDTFLSPTYGFRSYIFTTVLGNKVYIDLNIRGAHSHKWLDEFYLSVR